MKWFSVNLQIFTNSIIFKRRWNKGPPSLTSIVVSEINLCLISLCSYQSPYEGWPNQQILLPVLPNDVYQLYWDSDFSIKDIVLIFLLLEDDHHHRQWCFGSLCRYSAAISIPSYSSGSVSWGNCWVAGWSRRCPPHQRLHKTISCVGSRYLC